MQTLRLCSLLAVVVTCCGGVSRAADSPLPVVLDLLDALPKARIKTALNPAIRKPGIAGGVKENALFLHPLDNRQPARAEYPLELPAVAAGEKLALVFDFAMADGITPKPGEVYDGVRFAVEVGGKRAFQADTKEMKWQTGALDLTPFQGRKVTISLISDAMGTSNYDWALWGKPQVLWFRGPSMAAPTRSGMTVGALAFVNQLPIPVKVTIKPDGPGQPALLTAPPSAAGSAPVFNVLRFSLAKAEGIILEFDPPAAAVSNHVWLAASTAQPQIIGLSAQRAVPMAGEALPVQAVVRNAGEGKLKAGQVVVKLQASGKQWTDLQVPALAPGAEWTGVADLPTSASPGDIALLASLSGADAPSTATAVVSTRPVPSPASGVVLENSSMRLILERAGQGFGYARLEGRQAKGWYPIGVLAPLLRVDLPGVRGAMPWDLGLAGGTMTARGEIRANARDAQGVNWQARLKIDLDPTRPLARLHYTWQVDKSTKVEALMGPDVHVGDGSSGGAKTWGLFPGLEYLYGGERSSNPRDFAPPLDDRRTPHPHKYTAPIMAVTVGPESWRTPAQTERFFCPDSLKDLGGAGGHVPAQKPERDITVALTWNPLHKWDGIHTFPSPRFSSPNFDEGMDNHRLALFLPSAPDFVAENKTGAEGRFTMEAGRTYTLEATLIVAPGPVLVAMKEWFADQGGIPEPSAPPRDFEDSLQVSRRGFLETLWHAKEEKWSHCIDWGASHAPGFATLLWFDAHVTSRPDQALASRNRVDLAVKNMLREGGPGLFTSQANCHILRWEFPFHYGYLPEAINGLEAMITGLIRSQESDGGWRFHPANAQQADLGQAGDSVSGMCANYTANLLRYARITGDTNALASGLKGLGFLEKFRVPRGAQTWECPMYEPDILAAANGISACLDAWTITRNARWLHEAVYWAETGVPFNYYWTLPDKPMMLGASIPVFGSTFYTHTWLAVPVQWCGLVYGYHVQHLAAVLEQTTPPANASPMPLALNFTPKDWRRIAEHLTVSGEHQQFADGPRVGAYPDSISQFTRRNGAFINPEDIVINRLALRGFDPDIQSASIGVGLHARVLSSGAKIAVGTSKDPEARFSLNYFVGEPSHTLMTGPRPGSVKANGQLLNESTQPLKREPGWYYDQARQRLYLCIKHNQPVVDVVIQ